MKSAAEEANERVSKRQRESDGQNVTAGNEKEPALPKSIFLGGTMSRTTMSPGTKQWRMGSSNRLRRNRRKEGVAERVEKKLGAVDPL